MLRPTREGHQRTRCRISRYRRNHQLASFHSMPADANLALLFGALLCVRKKEGRRFCGTFLALVDAMLLRWPWEACSTRENSQYVHDEPYSPSEVEFEHCGSAGGRDRK